MGYTWFIEAPHRKGPLMAHQIVSDSTETMPDVDTDTCRCGRAVGDIHPCHAGHYTCHAPGTRRRYSEATTPARDTWACDTHWHEYHERIAAHRVWMQFVMSRS